MPLGLLLGWFRPLYLALNPLIQVLRPISPIAWIPLAILWFGVRYDQVVAGMVIIGVIGLALDHLVRRLERFDEVSWGYGQP